MTWCEIDQIEVTEGFQSAAKWKAPGHDRVPNFWYKSLKATYRYLACLYNELINSEYFPSWLATGKTTLIPKNQDTAVERNYRPITCLPSIYKNFTSILYQGIYAHIEQNIILPPEQKGCCKLSKGCQDQLMLSNFGVIDWRLEEIKAIDRKTRKLLTLYGMLHPRADTDRLYVSRKEGGRGLQQVEAAYKSAILRISDYCENSPDRTMIIARNYDFSLPKESPKPNELLSIEEVGINRAGPSTDTDDDEVKKARMDLCSATSAAAARTGYDIGKYVCHPPSNDEEKLRALKEPWIPSDTFKFPVTDTELDARFKPHESTIEGIQMLLPEKTSNDSRIKENLEKIAQTFLGGENEGTIFLSEYEIWHNHWKSVAQKPATVLDAIDNCDDQFFPSIKKLLIILATLSVSTVTPERSFSTLKRLKTYLRNKMGDERLTGLALMSVHRDLAVELDSKEIINQLAIKHSTLAPVLAFPFTPKLVISNFGILSRIICVKALFNIKQPSVAENTSFIAYRRFELTTELVDCNFIIFESEAGANFKDFLLTIQTTKEKYSSKTKASAADHDKQYSNVVGNKKNEAVSLRAKTKP
ncbi:unnamed protein product [Acanthoscelides obtectus]|uniref:HAT C-terminal dimerisation domain-containing protein n=1 Tax=Acanthoscelides obtectus TaxID=200917 RepID=A0A9P0MGP8_ACAOB|nr:unnamed protein product [Acanthoscelides obtectus]CAK1672124.1 52 kDa repressor of the inhibitor of the protein kinase [Acanthoscelides obtectus]